MEENLNQDELNQEPISENTERIVTPSPVTSNPVKELYSTSSSQLEKVIIGQQEVIKKLLAAVLSGGHVLLEGVPGVAKTLIVKSLSKALSIDFNRIQFTPDLMPTDVLGTSVYNSKTNDFEFKKGPIFSNFILIDEINRAPAKTQAALFEVMEEKQITVDGTEYQLGAPLFIVATQNPIEQEGTYRLPEAQLDRFVFKLNIHFPSLDEEFEILNRFKGDFAGKTIDEIESSIGAKELQDCFEFVQNIHIKDELLRYIAEITHETRNNGDIYLGASSRASLSIMKTSKAMAAIEGRDFVVPDDIKTVAKDVLAHRIVLSPDKEMEGITNEEIIEDILANIEVPR